MDVRARLAARELRLEVIAHDLERPDGVGRVPYRRSRRQEFQDEARFE
jgi:hypothetical protein